MRNRITRTLSVAALGLGLALAPLAASSHAQGPDGSIGTSSGRTGSGSGGSIGTSSGNTGTDAGTSTRTTDDRPDYGWLGLLGLAGLAGLIPKRNHTVTTHRTGDVR